MGENLYTHRDGNIWRTWMLMGVFLVVVIAFGWGLSFWFDSPAILYVAVIFSFILNFVAYWNSDKIVLSMTKAREVKREEHRELWDITENLCIASGLPMPRLYIVDDPSPNAFATGRNPKHGVVAVTTGLLQILDRAELEGVVAHEMAHIGNRDTLVSTVAVVLAGLIAIASDIAIRSAFIGRGNSRQGSHPVVMIIGLVLILLAPLAATLIRLAVSRRREFLADATGALMTRYPDGLANALVKISRTGTPMRTASNATAHLFISNPFGGGKMKGLGKLFMTHPPMEDRVRALVGK